MASNVDFGPNYMGTQVGFNYGDIQVHHPARPETPPEPLSTVPFDRDPDFVTCGSILDAIDEKCSSSSSTVALFGLGGVGKSQLAIEYCYRVCEKSPGTWALWVHASNSTRLELSYREIADRLKIPGRNDSQASVFQLVYNWLHEAKRGKWVLILDNLDDESLLREPVQAHSQNPALRKSFQAFLPRCPHGTIVLTTRNKQVARIVANECDIITVEPMAEMFALALVKKKLHMEAAEDDIRELVETLEFMPLAIVQAASYIRKQAPLCSVPRYLKVFRKNHRVLDQEDGHPRRDYEASKSILLTWQISFDYILQTRPSAADLLSLMSLFDRQGIPRRLLQDNGPSNPVTISRPHSDTEDSEAESDDEIDFNMDILTLRDFSFISVNQSPASLEMHRLVQLAVRNWLEAQGKFEQLNERFINILCDVFPHRPIELEKCRRLFPHVKSAMSRRPSSEQALLNWATLLYHASTYAWEDGKLADMKRLAFKSKAEREKLLGPENASTLRSSRASGVAIYLQGRWQEAEALQTQLMETIQRVFGDDDSMFIPAMHDLALTWGSQKRWQEAETFQVQILEKSKQRVGEDHHDTLAHAMNLAVTYSNQGKFKLAEGLLLDLFRKCQQVIDKASIIDCVNALATTYTGQKRFDDAETLLMQILEIHGRIFGNKHPSTLDIMGNLACNYMEQKRWGKAEELLVQVFATREQVLGEVHPNTLTTLNNLGIVYAKLEKYSESEALHVRVAEARKRVLGEDHLDTLESQGMVARAYVRRCRWKDAEELQISVFEKCTQLLGESHPLTILSQNDLAGTYGQQGRFKDMFTVIEKGSTVNMPKLTRMPILKTSDNQKPSETYHPMQPRDIFEVFSILHRCGQGRLPRRVVFQILDLARYWILHKAWRKGTLCVAEDDCRERASYLATELIPGLKYPIREILFQVSSHDQGWSDDSENHGTFDGSWTWFDLDVERPSDSTYDGIPRRKRLITNLHACLKTTRHQVSFTQLDDWVRNLQVGDQISVIPMARFPGWLNLVKEVSIEVYTTCLLSP